MIRFSHPPPKKIIIDWEEVFRGRACPTREPDKRLCSVCDEMFEAWMFPEFSHPGVCGHCRSRGSLLLRGMDFRDAFIIDSATGVINAIKKEPENGRR